MKLARKMDPTRRRVQVSALWLLLFKRFVYSPIGLVGKKMQMLESMPKRYASLKLKKLHKKMEIEISILDRFLPIFMFLGITQRAFGIKSLHGMQLAHRCEISMKGMASLRTLFRMMYASEQSFSVEFVSNTNQFVVIHFSKKNGRIFMKSESYDQLGGDLFKDGDTKEVMLNNNLHTIDITLTPVKDFSFNHIPFLMRLFYTPSFTVPSKNGNCLFICRVCSFYSTPLEQQSITPLEQQIITDGHKKRRIA